LLFPAHAVTLYQEGEVQIAPKAAVTLASGSTLIMRKGGDLYVNGAFVVQLTSDRSKPAPGDWGRIEFDGPVTGTLSNVHLS